jgi:dihydroorotate dehydrogenase (NAD+) catalytic subunit
MNENKFETINKNPVDLSVSIAGIRLRNPVIAASGTFGHGKEYSSLFDVSLLGGICTKGLTMSPKIGNNGIRIWETPSGMLNSIGLENPGIPVFLKRDLPYLRQLGPAIIANLSGEESDDYVQGAVHLNESSIDMIELNISCPNVRAGGMAFGLDPGTAAALTAAVRRVLTNKPLMVKLSPNAPNLAAIALACVNAGADALSLVNTFKAMAIDTVNRKPIFFFFFSGLSGPSIILVALRIAWELFDSLKEAKLNIPIVGIGGIACTNDALEFLMAGASAIQVGSATFVDPYTMSKIIDGIHNYLVNHEMSTVNEISIRR